MVFLGRSIAEHRNYSETIARKIDAEVRQMIAKAHSRALETMTTYRQTLEALAQQLMAKETLNEEEVNVLLSNAAG
jgi:cell division protease FtsH